MISGVVVGIVIDNVDPDGMHRIKVEYPVDAEDPPETTWVRMITPMAGKDRGLVILPDLGTEVIIGFAYRTLQAYCLEAVYNGGEDLPEPYHNDDGNDDIRVFWSRNDHMLLFDDTGGAEVVGLGAQAGTRLDVTSAPIYDHLDAAQKVVTEYCDGTTTWEAAQKVSIKCTDFELKASASVTVDGGSTVVCAAGSSAELEGATQKFSAGKVDINGGSPGSPTAVLATPAHKHPPTS